MKTARSLFNRSSLPYSATSSPICHINLVLASSPCFCGAAAYDWEEDKIRRFKKQISNFQEFSIKDPKNVSANEDSSYSFAQCQKGCINILYLFHDWKHLNVFFLFFFSLFSHLCEAWQVPTAHACPGRGSYFLLSRGYLLITIVLSTFLRSLIL